MTYDINQTQSLPPEIRKSGVQQFAFATLEPNYKTGKPKKQPVSTKNVQEWLDWSDPVGLVDYDTAVDDWVKIGNPRLQQQMRLDVLLKENFVNNEELIVIDIDHRPDLVKQARNRVITTPSMDVQAKVVEYALSHNFYIEVSQSGEGLHLMTLGHKQISLSRNDKFEYYDRDRWIIMTGDCAKDTENLESSSDEIKYLEKVMFPNADKQTLREKAIKSANIKHSNVKIDEKELNQIIQKAINARNGDKFAELFNGESPSGDVSSDDMSFALMLAFWTQKNYDKMDAIFRKSKRMRDKWDERHYSDGSTYGETTLERAIANTNEVYHEPTKDFHVDKSKVKSNQDLYNALADARKAWDQAHTVDGKTAPITSKPLDIIKILLDIVDFAIIYNNDPSTDQNLYFFNHDTGVYSQKENELEALILAVVPEMVNSKTRQNLLDTILKLPTSKIPVVQNVRATDEGRYLTAVGNGVLNLKTKKLFPFSPKIYITSKIETDYNPKASNEPIINGWSWSRSLKETADGDLDKLTLLWQVVKAATCGYSDLRQAVLLVDDGHGMTGKSTFEEAIINVVGKSNTAQLRLAEMSDETKLIDAVDKTLIVGDDNDVHTVISRYDYLNPVISRELIRVRNYYQKSQSTVIRAFVLQSCNGIPPFKHATTAFFNRLKMIKFNHRHNPANPADWRVKNDYIKRKEFKEWLLWYVVNNVELDVSLMNTQENKDLIADAQIESDTVESFIENWLPDINSTVIPVAWLYDYYTTTCVVDSMPSDSILSRKRFVREIMNKDKFAAHWDKKAKRLSTDTFLYSDVKVLMNLYNSTHGDRNLKTWLPVTTVTEKQDNDNTVTHRTITKEDYLVKVDSYHSFCFVKK